MKSDGPLDNATEVLSKRKKNQGGSGSSLNLTRGKDNGKNQVPRSSGPGIGAGMGYLDNSGKDIRVPNQVKKGEYTGQGKRKSTDSQTGFVRSRASGHPHTKAL